MKMTPPKVPPTIAATGVLEPLLSADLPLLSSPAIPELDVAAADDVDVAEDEEGDEVTIAGG